MTTISINSGVTTAINTFTVGPEHQQKVVELLSAAVDLLATNQAGFISESIHRSMDGKRVLNYVQWGSKKDFESVFGNTGFMKLYAEMKAISTPEPLLYEVVHSAIGTVPST